MLAAGAALYARRVGFRALILALVAALSASCVSVRAVVVENAHLATSQPLTILHLAPPASAELVPGAWSSEPAERIQGADALAAGLAPGLLSLDVAEGIKGELRDDGYDDLELEVSGVGYASAKSLQGWTYANANPTRFTDPDGRCAEGDGGCRQRHLALQAQLGNCIRHSDRAGCESRLTRAIEANDTSSDELANAAGNPVARLLGSFFSSTGGDEVEHQSSDGVGQTVEKLRGRYVRDGHLAQAAAASDDLSGPASLGYDNDVVLREQGGKAGRFAFERLGEAALGAGAKAGAAVLGASTAGLFGAEKLAALREARKLGKATAAELDELKELETAALWTEKAADEASHLARVNRTFGDIELAAEKILGKGNIGEVRRIGPQLDSAGRVKKITNRGVISDLKEMGLNPDAFEPVQYEIRTKGGQSRIVSVFESDGGNTIFGPHFSITD